MNIECPNHEGSFDCTPFCEICNGAQEFEPIDLYKRTGMVCCECHEVFLSWQIPNHLSTCTKSTEQKETKVNYLNIRTEHTITTIVEVPKSIYLTYDLNVFYEDLGDGEWADVYTIQPSVYKVDEWERSSRHELSSFKLTLAETRAIAPDFAESIWGSDFFIGIDSFLSIGKAIPDSVIAKLNQLPALSAVDLTQGEIKWQFNQYTGQFE